MSNSVDIHVSDSLKPVAANVIKDSCKGIERRSQYARGLAANPIVASWYMAYKTNWTFPAGMIQWT